MVQDSESSALLPMRRPAKKQGVFRLESTWLLVDLGVLSVGICATFCAYNGAQQIITTLLPTIGSLSLGIVYSVFAVACTVAPMVVRALGLKASIAIQLLFLSLWIASSLRPSIELAIPVAAVLGFFAAAFWTAVPTYIATICAKYDNACAAEAGEQVNAPTPIPSGAPSVPVSVASRLLATLKLAVIDPRLMLMVPLFLFQGAEQAFIFSVFGSRLVAPVFGDGMVGTISVGFGVTNVVASLTLGRLTDSFGWPGPLAVGLVAQVSVLAVLIAWRVFDVIVIEKNPTGIAVMYTVAGAWGIGDAAFNTVVSTMLGNFFPPGTAGTKTEAAFANMRLWASLFTGVCFFGMPQLHRHTNDRTSIAVELIVPLAMALVASAALVILGTCYTSSKESSEPGKGDENVREKPKRNTLGMFQGIFFGAFMTTHISGNALSGIILGSKQMNPPHQRVIELFLVYTSLGIAGCIVISIFLRSHSPAQASAGTIGSMAPDNLIN